MSVRVRVSLVVGVAALAIVLAAVALHRAALQAAGRLLTDSQPVEAVDLAVTTADSGLAGKIELSDLFREHRADRVAIFDLPPTAADRELERRGIHLQDDREILAGLGVPIDRVVSIPTREMGTTESTVALREWCTAHRTARVIVVVSATHGRRFRRALQRVWGRGTPMPIVTVPRFDSFRPEEWWQHRSTLRDGLVEMEKLLLDVLLHPFELRR